MHRNDQANRMRRHLERLCGAPDTSDLDLGGWATRFAAVSAAIGMAAALGACYGTPPGQMIPPDSPEVAGDLSEVGEPDVGPVAPEGTDQIADGDGADEAAQR